MVHDPKNCIWSMPTVTNIQAKIDWNLKQAFNQEKKSKGSYRSSTISPRVLPNHCFFSLFIFKSNVEHFSKVLTQTM